MPQLPSAWLPRSDALRVLLGGSACAFRPTFLSASFLELERLRSVAGAFRLAIEALSGAECPAAFSDFPYGSCRGASLLLGVYLRELGLEVLVVTAGRSGQHWGTHAWLEQGATSIDITADQFSSTNARVVVAADSPWHRTWVRDSERIPYLADLDCLLDADLLRSYIGLRGSMRGSPA